jgi:hypothetical protein
MANILFIGKGCKGICREVGNLLLSRLATPSTIKKGGLSYTTTPIESVSIVMDLKCS